MIQEKHLKIFKNTVIAIGVVFTFVILAANIKRSLNFGLPTYDYGIYQQAIFEIAHQKKLNPFMSVRDEYVFNDHFMPILLTAVPGVWLTNYANWFLTSYEWLWYVLFLVMVFYLTRNSPPEEKLGAMVAAFFCKGWLFALHFSAHPGPWSGVIWLILVYGIVKRYKRLILWSALSLILFRESYVFCLFSLGLYYLVFDDKKLGAKIFGFSLAYMFFLFYLRGILIGPSFNYAERLLRPFIADPVAGTINHLKTFKYKMVFKLFLPYLIPLVIWAKEAKREGKFSSPYVATFMLITPYYAMHFLSNKFNYQYGVAAVVPLLSLTIFTGTFRKVYAFNRYLYALMTILFLLNGTSYYKKFWSFFTHRYDNGSVTSASFNNELKTIQDILHRIPKTQKIVSTSFLTARMLQPGMTNVHTVEEFMKHPKYFDILVYQKHKTFPLDPNGRSKHEYMMETCKNMISEVLFNSDYYFIARGKFSRPCYVRNHQ